VEGEVMNDPAGLRRYQSDPSRSLYVDGGLIRFVLFTLELQQMVDDGQGVFLKVGVQFVKEADNPFFPVKRGGLEHFPVAGFEPLFADPEGKADEREYPVSCWHSH
jgi:hypothetical protein